MSSVLHFLYMYEWQEFSLDFSRIFTIFAISTHDCYIELETWNTIQYCDNAGNKKHLLGCKKNNFSISKKGGGDIAKQLRADDVSNVFAKD
jgi:hypothetical protein